MLVDWLTALDLAFAAAVGALGTALITSVTKKKKNNGAGTPCAFHDIIKSEITDIKSHQEDFILKDMCNQKHSELLRRIDDLREHIDDKHEALMQILNRR